VRPFRLALAALLPAAACSHPPAPTAYLCEGGDTLLVGFGPRYAELHLPPDRVVRLRHEPAASGARYSDGRFTVHEQGGEALLQRGGKLLLKGCRAGVAVVTADSSPTSELAAQLADSIDSLTADRQPLERRLQAQAAGWDPAILRLWADSARPVRLEVAEASLRGAPGALVEYYFTDGQLAVVRGPVNQYLFRDTTLILWTTDSLHATADIPLRDMVARQNFVLGEVRQYLAMFGLEQ